MRDNQHTAGGVSTSSVDAFVAALLILGGGIVMYDSAKLGFGWASDGPQSGYFPFYCALFVVISSVITLYKSLFGKNRDTEPFVRRDQLKLVLSVLVPLIVFVAAIHFIGIYASSALFIAGFMAWLGKYSWKKYIPISLGVAVFFFLMFEIAFKVPLPKNAFDDMLVSSISKAIQQK